MLLEVVVTVITVVANLFLGLLGYTQNRKSATNVFLFALAIVISLWTVSNYFSLHQTDAEQTLFWIRFVMFVTAPLGPLIFLLIHTFPNDKIQLKKKYLFVILALMIATAALSFTPLIFESVSLESGQITPQPGKAIPVYALDFMGLSLLAFILLVKKFIKSEGILRQQLKFLLLGVILTFTFIIVVFVTVVLTKSSFLVAFGPLSSLILIGFITYSVVKHQLFSIKVFATQLITVILGLILFSKLFAVQSSDEFLVDIFIFIFAVLFGIILIRSVTREVEQRKKLEELTKKLQELDQRKDEFLNIAAHELRAPMTAIKGYLSMIMEGDAGAIPDQVREFLTEAASSNDRLIRLVNNMLNTARIEENRQVYTMAVVSLSKVVETVFREFEQDAKNKKLEYVLTIQPNIHDSVYVDSDRIHEVVGNFISNAIKYTDQGKVSINLLLKNPEVLRFEVVDTGPGIATKDQTRLFEKFYRVENENLKRAPGTGLGLYISKILIEKFGGQIGFLSAEGTGSTFWFELPLTSDGTPKPKIMV